ncbi:ATP-binding protein [Kitasatospora cathayae]|uniref:BTAD domain-containing putative transcriptional regulator n=1 Tax=Kitasatospora cathayae TaxID=3004092 RepID=A0ABY7Q115_9ACTN|nr:BTAD domain-containing putative transcriptional regulator [Kitasatospora sp. HUAS 3-15]WBP86342.1 BTAD domain-containing putative transcriptional regulator [Kitasatospora sp. HUAS 3-15]
MTGMPSGPCYTVLGTVGVLRGEDPLPVGPPQQRALLAMLLLRRNTTVGLDELIDGLWGEEPPRAAAGTVRLYVHRLRHALGPEIATHGKSYALRVAPGALDLDAFEEQVARARARLTTDGPGAAAELLARALTWWRGVPLAGLPGPHARIHRERLSELRLAVLLERIELDLQLGHHARLIPELTALCEEHPGDGRLDLLLDTARAHSGRNGTVRTVADSPPSRRAPEKADGLAAALPPPAQLPYVPGDFTGRDEEMRTLVEALTPTSAEGLMIAAVSGMGGVGKTTLAVHAAQRLRGHFPDGQLYANLRGMREDPADPAVVLAGFLRALGVADSVIPDDQEGRAALYRTRLAGRRILVVLDDARNYPQIEALLPGTPDCAVVVTSRTTIPELPAAPQLRLDVLPTNKALALFRRIAGLERVAAEPEAAAALATRCGGLPLALRLAGSRLVARPAWSLSDMVRLLDGSRWAMDAPAGGADGLATCFRHSYDLLGDEEARLFRLMAIPRQPTTDTEGAAALAGLPPAETGRCLERLADLGLLETPVPDTYRFHDLLREFAAARSEEQDRPEERAAALTRLLDHFLTLACAAYARHRPGHPLVGLLLPAAPPGPSHTAPDDGPPRGLPEPSTLLAVAEQVLEAAPAAIGPVANLVLALEPLLDRSFRWDCLVSPARRILDVAEEQGHLRAAGRIGHALGSALTMVGRFDEAEKTLHQAEQAMLMVGDEAVRTETLTRQALVWQCQGDWERAEAGFRRAIAVGEDCGNAWGVGNSLLNSVSSLLRLGRLDDAATTCRAALESVRASKDHFGHAHALYQLGVVTRHLGEFEEAVARHRQSAELGARNGYPAFEVLNGVSETAALLAANRASDAAECGERAVAVARRLGWRAAEARALRLVGTAFEAAGERDLARQRLTEAVELLTSIGLPESAQAKEILAGL